MLNTCAIIFNCYHMIKAKAAFWAAFVLILNHQNDGFKQ